MTAPEKTTPAEHESFADEPRRGRARGKGDPVIRLVGIRKSLGGTDVLRDMNLELNEGETLVIIGLSGTGKSVTLRHIVGLLQPDEGEVWVFGKNMARLTAREKKSMRLRIGYLFQSGALINWLTIRENVALPLREHHPRLPESEIEKRVVEKLRLVNMEDALDKLPAQISGGMKKRGGLARAIILEPEVILYDEPTSGLDPVMAATIDQLVIHTREALGVSQIVVTHDMESAFRIADRIAMLYGGRIVALGTPDEIRATDDPLVRQFIEGTAEGPITEALNNATATDRKNG